MMCQRVCTTSSKDKSVGKISPSGPDWVDDTNVTQCKSCGFVFSFIIRKHHCRMCGHVFCRYCAAETWPLPKFEYLSPVRVCRKCARLCWKAEALVQAIQANDVNSLIKYVQRKNDCNLHIAVFPPLTVAAGEDWFEHRWFWVARAQAAVTLPMRRAQLCCCLRPSESPPAHSVCARLRVRRTASTGGGFSEVCRVLISGGAKVEHRVPEPKNSIYVQCSFCLKMAAHKVRCSPVSVHVCREN